MLKSLPYWLSINSGSLVAIEKYEQDRLNGFLIINFDKETYLKLSFPDPLSIEDEFSDENEILNKYYIFDKNEFFQAINNIQSFLIKFNEKEKLEEIKNKYNINPIEFK